MQCIKLHINIEANETVNETQYGQCSNCTAGELATEQVFL
jgi:hypothetical protein